MAAALWESPIRANSNTGEHPRGGGASDVMWLLSGNARSPPALTPPQDRPGHGASGVLPYV